jgi:hypothetical protein
VTRNDDDNNNNNNNNNSAMQSNISSADSFCEHQELLTYVD